LRGSPARAGGDAAGHLRLPGARLPPGHGRALQGQVGPHDRRRPRRVAHAGRRQVPPAQGGGIRRGGAVAGEPQSQLPRRRHPGARGEPRLRRHPRGGERAVQALGFASDEEPLETVEAMAALYVDALLSFQPQGPYLLAGSSLGGLIAFEMARRLRSLQREVAFLGLLDAPDPARFPRLEDDGDGDAEMTILQYVTQRNPPVTLEGLRALDPEARLELILEQVRR